MDCKTIQTWIITDYLDSELDTDKRQALENHIKTCSACLSFLEEVKNPKFDNEYLWSRIKAKIEEKPRNVLNISLERIMLGLRAPKPIFALSTFACLLIAVFVLTQGRALYQKTYNQRSAEIALTEQLEYFSSDEITFYDDGTF